MNCNVNKSLKKLFSRTKSRLPNNLKDDFEYLYESSGDEVEEVLVAQLYLNANNISLERHDEPTFPWHGHTREDFERLNRNLSEHLDLFRNCKSEKRAAKLKRAYPELFSAYFKTPIRVQEREKGYELLDDGRHRVRTAQASDSIIPVWVVRCQLIQSESLEDYMRQCAYGNWRFELDEEVIE